MPTNKRDVAIGKRIREARTVAGWSQGRLSDELKVAQYMVSKYESAKCRIAARTLWQVADALNVDIRYFFKK